MKESLLAFAMLTLVCLPAEGAPVHGSGAEGAGPQPSPSATLPAGTTIYLGTGVLDNGAAAEVGVATTIICTNGSGIAATVRFAVLRFDGSLVGSAATVSIPHGGTWAASTHLTQAYSDDSVLAPSFFIQEGGLLIESTQTAVFCSAQVIDASSVVPIGVPLRLFRLNPHPGVVE